MTLFRPCIDLHEGKVKQIVGGTLTDSAVGPRENFVSDRPASYFSELYARDGLLGGHVIQLGKGNEDAARSALSAYAKKLQLGGGVTPENARTWLDAGASQVIVTSYLFEGTAFSEERLEKLALVVRPDELVIDLSCRKTEGGWNVATNRWQTVTETRVDADLFERLRPYCSEFLIHAADVEGLCRGIDEELVRHLAAVAGAPVVYAGGAKSIADLALVERLSAGAVDLTYGSSLDIFGGTLVKYDDCVAWNRARRHP